MRLSTGRARRSQAWSTAVVVLVYAAALTSAFWGARVVLPQLDSWREHYGAQDQSLREEAVVRSLGFDASVWERLRRSVRRGDRYAVVADGLDQHEVRNYAAYSLLPAIQVADVADANVVVYYATDPPPESRCAPIGNKVCVVLRAGS